MSELFSIGSTSDEIVDSGYGLGINGTIGADASGLDPEFYPDIYPQLSESMPEEQ